MSGMKSSTIYFLPSQLALGGGRPCECRRRGGQIGGGVDVKVREARFVAHAGILFKGLDVEL